MLAPQTGFNVGYQDRVCPMCSARVWEKESYQTGQWSESCNGICCTNGKVDLPNLPDTPPFLKYLFTSGDERAKDFRKHIRKFNTALSFTSMGAKVDERVTGRGGGPPVYRIQGEVRHRIGSLLPEAGRNPLFAQFYVCDTQIGDTNRPAVISASQTQLCRELQAMLTEVNPYARAYRTARERLLDAETPAVNLQMRLLADRAKDGRRYNLPTADEVAALMVGDGSQDANPRDIILQYRDGRLRRIYETFVGYYPLGYPLLFPWGEDGWHRKIKIRERAPAPTESDGEEGLQVQGGEDDEESTKRQFVTMREFSAFRLQVRQCDGPALMRGGRLLQQFIVDSYASLEQNRVNYLKMNQDKLRADVYQGLQDAVMGGDYDGNSIGRRVVLPSSFNGGPRHMMQNYQDAMAICATFGKPDLFVTVTCNPNWPEITEALLPNQKPSDRPDLVARAFHLRKKELQRELYKTHIFGKSVAHLGVIEFQKRGLPHCHMLMWLAEDAKLRRVEDIDRLISAEIPDRVKNPLAFATVSKYMMHGPCGTGFANAPCMEDGKCSKGYPCNFRPTTSAEDQGYPKYRRRQNGETVLVKNTELDNQWVVPHNLYLCTRYDCHINVEAVHTVGAIKYLFKYVYKGHDKATAVISRAGGPDAAQPTIEEGTDEIKQYIDCRYVSASEASWRLYAFPMQDRSPSVERLPVYLEGQEPVVFEAGEDLRAVLERPVKNSMLDAYFAANAHVETAAVAKTLTYSQFPTMFVWKPKQRQWKLRQRGSAIGRLYYAPPSAGERYYLRMLLHTVKGATSFEDLRTVHGTHHATFKQACVARGLLEDDNEWHTVLGEAGVWQTGKKLRELFCDVTNPLDLWNAHWEVLSDDLEYLTRQETNNPSLVLSEDALRNRALYEIEQVLIVRGKDLECFALPPTTFVPDVAAGNRLIQEQLNYDQAADTNEARLNADQLLAYQTILDSVTSQEGKLFFLDGPGGTGKTFVWTTLLARLRGQGKIVLAVASSGIAALLLPGGQTAHSRFGIPIQLTDGPSTGMCNGTRLIVKRMGQRVIEATILTGANIGAAVFIPRIAMTTNEGDFPFVLRRRQFPLKVAYAMTINKSQGQTMTHVGLYLPVSVFAHGQLYVGVSRTTASRFLKILNLEGPEGRMRNVVYKEVLQ
ncbi:hypothetical protein OSTOST_13057 [Ostertagia ostertagi]